MTDQTITPTWADGNDQVEDDRNIINIPAWNLERLNKEMAKLNKKAKKCGSADLTYEIIREYTIKDPRRRDHDELQAMYGIPAPTIKMLEIEILGEGPKIAGWTFLGTFDHNTLPGSVIVNTVPGETIPAKFHNCEPICEHCNKKRIRNETFLLQEDATGDYKLIGRQCVRDYIGYDARTIFQFLTALRKFTESFDEDNEEGWFGGGGRWADMFDVDEILRTTAAIIHKEGWVSKSKADWDQTPTSAKVVYTYYAPTEGRALAAWKEWIASLELDNPKWAETAKAAREWLKEQPDNNEYMHNLHTIDQNPLGEIPTRLFGYWCSLVSSYQRAMDKLNEEAKWPKINEHVGELKERRTFKVKLYSLRTFEGGYGYVHLHKFLDAEGHTLVWFASREQDFEPGEEYTIVGTVKKHDEYNGWAQTVITRVSEAK